MLPKENQEGTESGHENRKPCHLSVCAGFPVVPHISLISGGGCVVGNQRGGPETIL